MSKLGITTSILLSWSVVVLCNVPSLPTLSTSPPQSTHQPETLVFLANLIHNYFRNFHVNLVNIDRDYVNTMLTGHLLVERNPVSIMEPYNLKPLKSFRFFHQQSSWSELNIIWNGSPHSSVSLPEHLKSHKSFNILLNLNTSAESLGETLLMQSEYENLKFKIELILTHREVLIQSMCFYCGDNGQPRVLRLGCLTCRSLAPVHYTRSRLFQDYTTDFNGRPLRVYAGTTLPTLNRFTNSSNGTWIPEGGFQVPLLLALQKKLNFRMNITLLRSFGRKELNGSYSGLIGKVNSGEAELGVGAVITFDRYLAVDFMTPNSIQCSVFSSAIPTNIVQWQAVFQSLSFEAWMILLAICIGFILPVYMCIYTVHGNCNMASPIHGPFQCFDFLYRTLLEQGTDSRRLFPQVSGRILLASWLYFSILLGNAYKSRLVSIMVYPVNEIVPNTFEELAASDYTIYTHFAGGALSKVIETTPSVTFRKISKRMILEKSMVKCIEYSLRPKTACISYYDNLNGEGNKNFTDRNGNNLYRKAPGTAFIFPVSVILPPRALYRDSADKAILHLIGTGMAQRMLDTEIKASWTQGKQWARESNSSRFAAGGNDNASALKFQHFQGVFAVLLAGFALAITLFVLEELCKYCSFREKYELNVGMHKMLTFAEPQ